METTLMKNRLAFLVALAIAFSACGGGDSGSGAQGAGEDPPAESDGGASAGNVVDPQPPGQAMASVDGREYTLTMTGGLPCAASADEFNFSYIIGDNDVVLGGGVSIVGGEWFGSVTLQIFENEGITSYSAKILDNPGGVAVDGQSFSYSGPMEMTVPSTDGSYSEPVDVGNGTFSATCG